MSRCLLVLVLVVTSTSCSLLPRVLQPNSPQSGKQGLKQNEQPSPEMMQRFEQKIAAQLLSEVPDVPRVRTAEQSTELIEKLDKLVNHSGLNLDLVTRPQRNQLLTLDEVQRALKFEQQYWPTKNHLADLNELQQVDTSLDASARNNSLIKSLRENLNDQASQGILYPQPLQLAALCVMKHLPKGQRPKGLSAYLSALPTAADVGPWIDARLKPFFNAQQLVSALVELENESTRLKGRLLSTETKLDRELEAFYSDPRYDIRAETNPEQLTLDIVSLHIEEVLQFYQRQQAVTILGISSAASDTIRVDHNTVLIYLAPITALPAFEFQAIAYQSAGELLAVSHWPFLWRRTLALAYGQWAAEQLAAANYFLDDESAMAHLTQQMLFIQLGIVEVKLALGQWSFSAAKEHLQNETPYTAAQVDRWLLRMLAEDGSYAAAALATKAFETKNNDLINVIEQEMARQLPASLADFLSRPGITNITAPAGTVDADDSH